ncbi:ammonia-forming cytochrome c nitrite reductase subunit c552 [Candidatus Thiosymbion oneisti]|uniref:ammonia-forming cytochrome c nitrite reductase subunit c552 n=1 Tax=Candidatus Thiosymbion oneisti TaxID=589554 RepID=UPI000B7DE0F9|nr:ammonia-forming cytochrome c nitrite reductase subunit c552 [Candidatus Thiosymbion oneisti]
MQAPGRRRHRSLIRVLGLGVLAVSIGALVIVRQAPIPEDATYVGSAACSSCHRSEYAGWHASHHSKMMRRVDQEGVVVADFNAEDMPFDPKQAVWAIGSRWEQQFMGHDGKTETLLPGAWLVAAGEWKIKGWDGWQVPVPRRRCHGCHTVGLNVETGEFVEPGIGCESCHGPGSWHRTTLGLGAIAATLDAQVCGQCHTRGRSTDGRHFFPVGYRPGAPLADYFRTTEPTPGQTSAAWWGNGREYKRHQEYAAWRRGGHADSLRHLKEGYDGRYGQVTSDCLRCHAAEAAIDPHRKHTLDAVEHGITCAVCHQVHGGLDRLRLECDDCHEPGAFYHHPERNADHVVCGDQAGVTCVDCHMPRTAKNGGRFSLHTHHPGIIPPSDTAQYGVPSSCAKGTCHADRQTEWLQAAFERHYR